MNWWSYTLYFGNKEILSFLANKHGLDIRIRTCRQLNKLFFQVYDEKKNPAPLIFSKWGSNVYVQAQEAGKDSTAAFQEGLLKADYYTH